MPTFPRATGALPRFATVPRFPSAMQSWGQSGKAQVRAGQNAGRSWEEVYPVLDTSLVTVRALLTAINRSLREGILWDVQHPYLHTRNGAGGGTPLVAGASQLGTTLNIDGASATITNWLRAGDFFTITGSTVVYDVIADVNTNGSGQAALSINPPIFAGGSPADNAPLEITAASIYYKAYIVDVSDFPPIENSRYLDAGLSITWRESPG